MLDSRIGSALNKIISVSRNRKPRKRTSSYEEDRSPLLSVTLHDDNIQEFDTRWDEVLLSMSKNPSDDILENLFKMRIRESAQLKTVLELVRRGNSSENIDAQSSKTEDDGEEKHRSETSIKTL